MVVSKVHMCIHCTTLYLLVLICLHSVVLSATVSKIDDYDDDGVPSLSEMDTYDVLAIVFMIIGLAVSSAGGVGGGVIMVPAMVLIMGFDIKRATPISNVAILGGAVANAWFNMRKRHPNVDRQLIDPELSLGMIPAVIGGTILGALINKLIPSYVLSLLFVVVLLAGGSRTMKKGITLHKKEIAKKKESDAAINEEPTNPLVSPDNYTLVSTPQKYYADDKRMSISLNGGDTTPLKLDTIEEAGSDCTLAQIMHSERRFAWGPHVTIMVCYLGIVALSIGNTSVTCGSVVYWVILLIQIPWIAVFVVFTMHYLHQSYLRKKALNYPYVNGDIQWTKKMVLFFPLGCIVAGIVAGMFGVGGGIITGPIMIELGIVPEVASSTTALMILYSSASATSKFAVFNMIAWDWALLLCAVAFVVTSLSQIVILSFVRRTGRQSIIVLCIATAVLIGGVIMTYQAIKTTVNDAGDSFHADICR
ncbi:protein [Plasmopara halstedii]|uniref:Protein n=1 Tax=Plasmopara halstedii TaxID=4781 RepID=A0A0P1A577_PLAHL|nr:protein [Plasmopara halstedii]CEG35138.1 protein [Plasmopara halstedii]|eukprot:XP_024571507.1 protein [Plasmopara halstedii]